MNKKRLFSLFLALVMVLGMLPTANAAVKKVVWYYPNAEMDTASYMYGEYYANPYHVLSLEEMQATSNEGGESNSSFGAGVDTDIYTLKWEALRFDDVGVYGDSLGYYTPGTDVEIETGNNGTYLIATWGYNVTYHPENGGDSTVEFHVPTALGEGYTITLPEAPENEGKTFGGWKIGEQTYAASATATINSNVDVYAVWKNTYTVTYDYMSDGYTEGVDKQFSCLEGTVITLPGYHDIEEWEEHNAALTAAMNDGEQYYVGDWEVNGWKSLGGVVEVTDNLTVYPEVHNKNEGDFIISFLPGSFNDVAASGSQVYWQFYGQTYLACLPTAESLGFTAPEVDGVVFRSWKNSDGGVFDPENSFTANNAVTFEAVWSKAVTITLIDVNGEETVLSELYGEPIYLGDSIDLGEYMSTEPVNGQYQIGWYQDKNSNLSYDEGEKFYAKGEYSVVIPDSITLYPIMSSPITITLNYADGETETVTTVDTWSDELIFPGDSVELGEYFDKSTEYDGKYQIGWYQDKNGNSQYDAGEEVWTGQLTEFVATENVDLYPIMTKSITITLICADGDTAEIKANGYDEPIFPGDEVHSLSDYVHEGLVNGLIQSGWYLDKDGDAQYDAGEEYWLYRQWNTIIVYDDITLHALMETPIVISYTETVGGTTYTATGYAINGVNTGLWNYPYNAFKEAGYDADALHPNESFVGWRDVATGKIYTEYDYDAIFTQNVTLTPVYSALLPSASFSDSSLMVEPGGTDDFTVTYENVTHILWQYSTDLSTWNNLYDNIVTAGSSEKFTVCGPSYTNPSFVYDVLEDPMRYYRVLMWNHSGDADPTMDDSYVVSEVVTAVVTALGNYGAETHAEISAPNVAYAGEAFSLTGEAYYVYSYGSYYYAKEDSYVWYYSLDNGDSWTRIEDANGRVILQQFDEPCTVLYRFDAEYECGGGDTVKTGKLASYAYSVDVVTPIVITQNLPDGKQYVNPGKSLTLTVVAENADTYQWYINENDGSDWKVLTGEIGNSYTYTAGDTEKAVLLYCELGNLITGQTVDSYVANVTVSTKTSYKLTYYVDPEAKEAQEEFHSEELVFNSYGEPTDYNVISAIPEKEGYTFAYWHTYNPDFAGAFAAEEAMSIRADTEFIGEWVQNAIFSFDANGGGGEMAPINNVYNWGNAPQCEFTAPDGKIFSHWQVRTGDELDETRVEAGQQYYYSDYNYFQREYNCEGSTFVAQWVDVCTISFSSGDAENVLGSMDSVTVAKGSPYQLPACGYSHEDKYFAGYMDEQGVIYQPGQYYYPEIDTQFVAQWADYLSVSFKNDIDGEAKLVLDDFKFGEVIYLPGIIEHGQIASMDTVASALGIDADTITGWKQGYEWYTEDYEFYTCGLGGSVYIDSNIILIPIIGSGEKVSLTVSSGEAGLGEKIYSVTPGTKLVLRDPTQNGMGIFDVAENTYDFKGWSYEDKEYTEGGDLIITVDEDTTVTALWYRYVNITLKGDPDKTYGEGVATEWSFKYRGEQSYWLTSPGMDYELEGYTLIGYVSSADDKLYPLGHYYYIGNEDVTFTAAYTDADNMLTFYFDGGDYTLYEPNASQSWTKGETFTMPRVLGTNPYNVVFNGWELYTSSEYTDRFDDKLYFENDEYTPAEGVTEVYAKATWLTNHNVSYNGVYVEGYTQTVKDGDSITLPTLNDVLYYRFLGWFRESNSEFYEAGASVTIEDDEYFTAQWEQVYSLDVNIELTDYAPTTEYVELTATIKNAAGELYIGKTFAVYSNNSGAKVGDFVTDDNGRISFPIPLSSNDDHSISGFEDGDTCVLSAVLPEGYSYGSSDELTFEVSFVENGNMVAIIPVSYYMEYTVSFDPGVKAAVLSGRELSDMVSSSNGNFYVLLPDNSDVCEAYNIDEDNGYTNNHVTKVGEDYFIGWTIQGDDSGTVYYPQQLVTIHEDTVFVAQWGTDTYTFTIAPGFYLEENEKVTVTHGADGTEYLPYAIEGLHLGEWVTYGQGTNSTHFPELNNTPLAEIFPGLPGMSVSTWIIEAYDDNGNITYSGGNSGGGSSVNGNMVVRPQYDVTFDVTLDYNSIYITKEDTIEGHPSGGIFEYVASPEYSYDAAVNVDGVEYIHTGWFTDNNQNGRYDSDTEKLLYYYVSTIGYIPLYLSDLEGTKNNSTLTALWEPGYIVNFIDNITADYGGTVTYTDSLRYLRADDDGTSIEIRSPAYYFSNQYGWNRDGWVFRGYTLNVDGKTYDADTIYNNSAKASLNFTANWEKAPYTLELVYSYADEMVSYTGTQGIVNIYTLDEDYEASAHSLSANVYQGRENAPTTEAGEPYNFHWTIEPMLDGAVHEEAAAVVVKDVARLSASDIQDLFADSAYNYTQFKVSLNLYDHSVEDGEVDKDGTATVTLNLLNESTPTVGEFYLIISADEGVGDFVGYDGNSVNLERDSSVWFYHRYSGQMPDKDPNTDDIQPYSARWTISPLDADGSFIYDTDGSPVSFDLSCNEPDEWMGGYLENSEISSQVSGEYANHARWRLTLSLIDPENPGNISGGIDNTSYFASLIINYTGISVKATYEDGSDADINKTFKFSENVIFTPVVEPEDSSIPTWHWTVEGYSNGFYDEFTGDTLSLSQLRQLDSDEQDWGINVYPSDADGERYGGYDTYYFDVLLTRYDYVAQIDAYEGENIIADPDEYSFDRNADITFRASLDVQTDELDTWFWTVYGNDTDTDGSFTKDSLSIAEICALNELEERWSISVCALDENEERISATGSYYFHVPYDGPFFVSIRADDVEKFTGLGNYQHNRTFYYWYYGEYKGTPENIDEDFLPYWAIVPVDESGQPIGSAREVTPNWNEDEPIWTGWVASDEVDKAWGDDGYTCETHQRWLLTLGIQDQEGNVYDATNETGYMASLIFDTSNPLTLTIEVDEDEYSGSNNTVYTYADTRIYQHKIGEDVEGYSRPYWTAVPLDDDGSVISGAPTLVLTPDSERWTDGWDEDDNYYVPGYITGEQIIAEAGEDYQYHSRWLVTLALADDALSAVYSEGQASIDVTFEDIEPPVSPYELYVVTTDANPKSYEDLDNIYKDIGDADVGFRAELYYEGELVTKGITYDWTIISNNPGVYEKFSTQEINIKSLVEADPDAERWTLCPTVYDDEGNIIESINVFVVYTDDVAISYPTGILNRSVYAGSDLDIFVEAVNATGYQWYKHREGEYTIIEGATEPTLSFTNIRYEDRGEYVCFVTGMKGDEEVTLPELDEYGNRGYQYDVYVRPNATVSYSIDEANDQLTLSVAVEPVTDRYSYIWYQVSEDEDIRLNSSNIEETSFVLDNASSLIGEQFYCDIFYMFDEAYGGRTYLGNSGIVTVEMTEPEPVSSGTLTIVATNASGSTTYTSIEEGTSYTADAASPGDVYSFALSYTDADGQPAEVAYEASVITSIDGEDAEPVTQSGTGSSLRFDSITLPQPDGEKPVNLRVTYMVMLDEDTYLDLTVVYVITADYEFFLNRVSASGETTQLTQQGSITVAADTTDKLVFRLVQGGSDLTETHEIDYIWTINESEASADIASGDTLDLAKLMALEGDSFDILVEANDATSDYVFWFYQTVNRDNSGSGGEPEVESGVTFTVNGQIYKHGQTATVKSGDVSISAAGYGNAADYAITYMIDGVPADAGENGDLTLSCVDGDSHTITATAVNPVATRSLYDEETGNYTASLYLVVSDTVAVTGGGTADVDPSDDADPNNPTAINVTGILMDDVTTVEDTVYSVEILWGSMAFEYHTTNTEAGKTWNAATHSWELNGTPESSSAEWRLRSSDALTLPGTGSTIFPNADQSYAVVFNHSNDAVDVDMAIAMYAAGEGIDVSLANVSGGVQGTASTTGLKYQLARGVVDSVYNAATGAAAKVNLANEATNDLSEDPAAPTSVARLNITISKPSA